MRTRILLVATSLLVILSLLAACGQAPMPTAPEPYKAQPSPTPAPTPTPAPLPKPAGSVLFTITGDITLPNVDNTVEVDSAAIADYVKEYTIDDPWVGAGMKYSGVLLSELWELAGAGSNANGVTLTATDGMRVRIDKEDLLRWPILVATQLSGKDLVAEQGGPAKLAFPPEAGTKYPKEVWMWYIKTIDIGVLAKPLASPAGSVLFTVTGNVDLPNVDANCVIDKANIAPYIKEYTINDPWVGDGMKYGGVLLSELWTLCGSTDAATAAILTAEDGMTVNVAKEDFMKWPILVALQLGGKDLVSEQGGPAKLAFPTEAGEKYPKEVWMWYIKTIQFGKPPKPLAAPTGTVLFKVTGMVDLPNVDADCVIDAANISKYVKEYTIDDPWLGAGQKYSGILLSELWKRCGANYQATTAILTAKDGMRVRIAKADLQAWPILIVTQAAGKDLDEKQGGPAKLAFPPEASEKYTKDVWMWYIQSIEFAKPPTPLAAATGTVLFTVTGKIETPNAGKECQVDAANIAKYVKEYTIDDPWLGAGQKYSGVLLSELWKRCGASNGATSAILTATDGMEVTIAKEDLQNWPILIVTQASGKELTDKQGGPAKLAFPPEAGEKYTKDVWMWYIKTIEFK
jgi:hypothetical protein